MAEPDPGRRPPTATEIGYLAQSMVGPSAMVGSGFELTPLPTVVDVDHRDLDLDEKGTDRHCEVQVKAATHLDREGRVVCFANYPEDAVPETPRFVYVAGLLDLVRVELARIWMVPSAEFNRLAYRQHRADQPGRVTLQFSCRAAGDPRWDRFEVGHLELGERLLDLVRTAPQARPLRLPGTRLVVDATFVRESGC